MYKLIFLIIVSIAISCGAICAQEGAYVDTNASVIIICISTLQSARQAGLPDAINSKSDIYKSIQDLGGANICKQQAANELVEWLFVSEPEPSPFASVTDRSLHPAASALISIGVEAVEPLKAKLAVVTTDKSAVLIVRCLRQIFGTEFNSRLTQLNTQLNSSVASRAINYVLQEQREPRGITLEPES